MSDQPATPMPPYAGDEPPLNSLGEVEPPIPHDPGDPPADDKDKA